MTDQPPVRLTVRDDDVWNATNEALGCKPTQPLTVVRCQGGCRLGELAMTKLGPAAFLSFDVMFDHPLKVTLGEDELGLRGTLKHISERYSKRVQPGDQPLPRKSYVLAPVLLVVPDSLPQEYPDLLVRCEHGDLLLNRMEVLAVLARKLTRWKVTVHATPRYSYEAPRQDFADYLRGETVTHSGRLTILPEKPTSATPLDI